MPRLRVGSVRPERIYTGSVNGFKVYAGSQWLWIQDADFDTAGSIIWTGQETTYGLGLPITAPDGIVWTGQLVSLRGTYTYIDVEESVVWTGQEVKLPVIKITKGDVVWTGQDVELRVADFNDDFGEDFTI
jgi:hypothetical protein